MKALSVALDAHYAGNALTLAVLCKLTRRDGLVFGFTSHDQAITYLSQAYAPTSVFDASAIATRGELNVDGLEAKGMLDSAGITAVDLEAGLWDGAAFEVLEVNFKDLSMGDNVLRVGTLGEIQRSGGTYTAELRGLMHALQNNIGRIVKPSCDAVLGDTRCKVVLAPLTATESVTVATSTRLFTTSSAAAAGYYTYGVLRWLTGANAGRSMEIKQHTTGGVISLQLAMANPVTVGDTFTVTPGCDKTKATCIAKFSNVVNFRGFSFVPGQDQVMKFGGQ